ncbi:MAG TPA: type II toxin-antitoxin system VapC family toxin [Solirubrobacterales bacterium]|nr:type II toxin-antitoxin system VapC family toxin [Solirubrobacterales bacterium]
MIVLDASVLIAHLDAADRHHDEARRLLEERGAEPLASSAITLAETIVSPARAGRLEDAEAALRRLGVEELAIGTGAAGRLAALRAGTGLKMPDCCVLLTALDQEAVLASFDARLIAAARELGLSTAP